MKNILNQPLRCTVREVVENLIRGIALRYGCTVDEVATIRARPGSSIYPCLATVRAGDGREVFRVGSIAELDALVANKIDCSFLSRAIRSACSAM